MQVKYITHTKGPVNIQPKNKKDLALFIEPMFLPAIEYLYDCNIKTIQSGQLDRPHSERMLGLIVFDGPLLSDENFKIWQDLEAQNKKYDNIKVKMVGENKLGHYGMEFIYSKNAEDYVISQDMLDVVKNFVPQALVYQREWIPEGKRSTQQKFEIVRTCPEGLFHIISNNKFDGRELTNQQRYAIVQILANFGNNYTCSEGRRFEFKENMGATLAIDPSEKENLITIYNIRKYLSLARKDPNAPAPETREIFR